MSDCIKSTGKVISQNRNVETFDKIFVEDNMDVYLNQDTIRQVKVEAGENLISLIETTVSGGELHIRNNNRCNWVRSYDIPVRVFITAKSVKKIFHNGFGKFISTDTIREENIYITVNNFGDVELLLVVSNSWCDLQSNGDLILKGRAGVNQLYTFGNNWVRLSELKTGYTFIWSNTTGDCMVTAEKEIGAFIYSSGNIFCRGNPDSVTVINKGAGKFIKE